MTNTARRFFVYMLASKPWGTLYVGVTNDVQRRVFEHKQRLADGFTKKYCLKTLVYFEEHATAAAAIHREKRLKKWPRAWKINLIRTDNPDWKDLAEDWYPKQMSKEQIATWLADAAKNCGCETLVLGKKLGRPDARCRAPGDDGLVRGAGFRE